VTSRKYIIYLSSRGANVDTDHYLIINGLRGWTAGILAKEQWKQLANMIETG
jgi:hypothetical protein